MTAIFGLLGIVLLSVGVAGMLGVALGDPHSWIRVRWGRYVAALDRELRFLRAGMTGRRLSVIQLIGVGGLGILAAVLADPILVLAAVIGAVAPYPMLRRRHAQRVVKIEDQLEPWLLILANGLHASPSMGEALASSARLVAAPMSEEVDLAVKEMKLGTPLDMALLNMSMRVESRTVSGAIAALLVARQTGGDLPQILADTAGTLREMARLEGVVKAKTAEARSQAMVLGAIPFVLIGAIHAVDNNWLRPLWTTTIGYLVVGIALTLWLAAILLSRRILSVDL